MRESIGRSRDRFATEIGLTASSPKKVLDSCLTPGQAHDAPIGRDLLTDLGIDNLQISLDRAKEGNETRCVEQSLGFEAVAPPPRSRRAPWTYKLDKRRSKTERIFGRTNRFRRVLTSQDRTHLMLSTFVAVAPIANHRQRVHDSDSVTTSRHGN